MPLTLVIIGTVLLAAGVRNTQGTLYSTLLGDFTGKDSFIWWAVSIVAIGSVGYIGPEARKLSNAFLLLILIVLVIHNQGVWANVTSALSNPVPAAPEQPNAVINNAGSNAVPAQSNSSSIFQDAGQAAALAAVGG